VAAGRACGAAGDRGGREWQFITAVANLAKAISSGHLTPAAITALPV
jgi:hypothetical protein